MKANEAPEKLYIDSREHWMKSWTAFTTKAKGDDIEYIRTDAFIEKAEEYLYKQLNEGNMEYGDIETFIENFVKYMEGD